MDELEKRLDVLERSVAEVRRMQISVAAAVAALADLQGRHKLARKLDRNVAESIERMNGIAGR